MRARVQTCARPGPTVSPRNCGGREGQNSSAGGDADRRQGSGKGLLCMRQQRNGVLSAERPAI